MSNDSKPRPPLHSPSIKIGTRHKSAEDKAREDAETLKSSSVGRYQNAHSLWEEAVKSGKMEQLWQKPEMAELRSVLERAFLQVARGKGHKVHGQGIPFIEQPIVTLTTRLGIGGPAYQSTKKLDQAIRQVYFAKTYADLMAAREEVLGAINFIAPIVLALDNALDTSNAEEARDPQDPLPEGLFL